MISNEIINFINQTEDIFLYNNIDNLQTIYHYSIPNTKLFYPEPFIASASFMHSDLWFIHILTYQYWLWFVFIFIIIFFFVTFICTIRWCNMRIKPRRETRGVSRSKCGDLITACVPVSWAASIIINESTDAIDYFDGFGTTELVVGIRAYQWGWEYYYPKDLDLNYNVKKNYSIFTGNSLKYNKSTELNLNANNLWKFYQNKNFDQVITPAHLLTLTHDNNKLLNFLNFNDIGSNTIYETNAFKKIKMFSKSNTTDLFLTNNDFSIKFKKISNLYTNKNIFLDTYSYGLKRQHNFLNNNSILNNNTTFLNLNSINKLINFNFKNDNLILTKIFLNSNNLNFFTENKNHNLTNFFFKIINLTNTEDLNNVFLNKYLINNSFLNKINNNTDKKKIKHPFFKIFNLNFKKNYNINNKNINNFLNLNSDLNTFNYLNETTLYFKNKNINYLSHSNFSPNQSIALANKNIKNFINIKPNQSNLNYSNNLNNIQDVLKFSSNKLNSNEFNLYNFNKINWLNHFTFNKLNTNKISFDFPYSPILSNNPTISFNNYDSHKNTFIENTPNALQGKEELLPPFLPNIYWNFYFSNSNYNWRINNNFKYFNLIKNFSFPTFFFYYDYDFRNWQSFELLEDAYWETSYSVYLFDEYLSLTKEFYSTEYPEKDLKQFLNNEKIFKNKNFILNKSFFTKIDKTPQLKNKFYFSEETYPLNLYTDDFLTPTNLTKSKNFSIYSIISNFLLTEDNYENLKFLNHFFNNNNNSLFFYSTNFSIFLNDSSVLNYFRSDFDEFSWFFDENNFFYKNFQIRNRFFLMFHFYRKYFMDIIELEPETFNFFTTNSLNQLNKFNNYINLRNTAKNSIVTHNAIQKVFRTRFDENRSHTKLSDFSNFSLNQPFINTTKIPYENLLGKNKKNYYESLFYKNKFKLFFNNFYFNNNSLNFYFYDFPFLMALKSDASRYLWFDWFAKWGFYEVQPSSSSRYALYGMPYFFKNFEFNTINNENLSESETYLIRISKARKNYLSNWTHVPYFYAKNNHWYKNNLLFNSIFNSKNNLNSTKLLLKHSQWYWNSIDCLNFYTKQFLPSNSNINTTSKTNWKPLNSVQSYYYNMSNLADILTKREFLYREFFIKSNKLLNLPVDLTASPANNLLIEIKNNFLFNNLILNNNEYSKNIFYLSLNHFNLSLLQNLKIELLSLLNLKSLSTLFFYFFNINTLNHNENIYSELNKNQYRPMRKGITNMIRLHATGAMALPIEIRLQLLASSKDVIHSWAIPSAGIKIDCVPGYSSHRVMIFLVSGIYWGQCMEICGRYHHWMPIIVYFMKRDLFFLWCTHFIFLSGANNLWTINDKQYSDYVRLASFDKNSWLSEIIF